MVEFLNGRSAKTKMLCCFLICAEHLLGSVGNSLNRSRTVRALWIKMSFCRGRVQLMEKRQQVIDRDTFV